MKLTYEQINSFTTGVFRTEKSDSGILFHRFSDQQQEMYRKINPYFFGETLCPAGAKIRFITDSKKLSLKFFAESVVYEKYILLDVEINGKLVGSIGNVPDEKVKNPFDTGFYQGEFSGEFSLGDGIKNVCIHLPYTAPVTLTELCLDDGAYLSSVEERKTWLALGDSITMGFQSVRPSGRYIARITEKSGYTEYNFGIGGEIFCPYLAKSLTFLKADIISVAYGTNYFSRVNKDKIISDCSGFLDSLRANFPKTKIIVITPVWRGDIDEHNHSDNDLSKTTAIIKEICQRYENLFVIDGIDLIPHDVNYFLDRRLHPNDEGNEFFAENLLKKIKNLI